MEEPMPRWTTLLVLVLALHGPVAAQTIPAARATDWSVAGYPGEIPSPATVVDVTAFGAKGDGVTPDQAAIAAAIQSLKGAPGVVFLPAGNYLLTGGLSLKSGVVLRGASAQTTWLRCNLASSGSTCLSIAGVTTGGWRNVTAGLEAGSTTLTVADATGLAPGDWVELREANGAWDTAPADWAKNVVGQLVHVVSVDGNVLGLEHPLRTTYDAALSPQLIEVVPATDVGVEDLSIERVSDPTPTAAGNNLSFSYAARCWVKGIESNKSIASHIGVYTSTQLEFTGCYFHDAFTFDGTGTRGYGVTLNSHTGECLVEGNIFSHLRHAMMAKTGANGNVFAYNYSREPHRSEAINDFAGDISLHGHWPFLNLFEGNIVANIIVDQYWGPAGPYNTFFRNRAELYGLIISFDSPSNDQNAVGNDVMAGKSNLLLFAYGLPYALKGTGHLAWGNDVKNSGVQPPGTSVLPDVSYYRDPASDFCQLAPAWPSIGLPNALGTGSNRARQRWDAGGVLTVQDLRVDAGPSGEIEVGESAQLLGRVSGGRAPVSLSWSPAEGLSDPLVAAPVASPTTSTTYTLQVTDGYGCVTRHTVLVRVTGDVEAPLLEPPPGTFTTPQMLTLTTSTPGAHITVTLDGSEPTEVSPLVTEGLPLDTNVTVRARAFRDDWTPSAIVTGDYVFEDVDECTLGLDACDEGAECTNTWLAYTCACRPGYEGDGFTCASVCGDHLIAGDEACDEGDGVNGTPGSCCAADCRLETGRACHPGGGPCDPAESCDGIHAACPADALAPDGLECDDDDACTTDDRCAAGACLGSPLAADACDDANGCTADRCDALAGCVHDATAAPCDGPDPCRTYACSDGGCTAVALVAGCCHVDADCGAPFELCHVELLACTPVLCAACVADADCGAPGNRCTPFFSGSACTAACDDQGACPAGSTCVDVGGGELQCLPDEGDCTCVSEASTACSAGDVWWVSSCGELEILDEACGGRGCVEGACCPEGTTETGGACAPPPVEPSPDAAEPDAPQAEDAPEPPPEVIETLAETPDEPSPDAATPEPAVEPTPEPTAEPSPEPAPEAVPETAPEAVPEAAPEAAPEVVADSRIDTPAPADVTVSDANADASPAAPDSTDDPSSTGGGSSCALANLPGEPCRAPLAALLAAAWWLLVRRRRPIGLAPAANQGHDAGAVGG